MCEEKNGKEGQEMKDPQKVEGTENDRGELDPKPIVTKEDERME
jgi:hypothetical protein